MQKKSKMVDEKSKKKETALIIDKTHDEQS